MMETKRLVLFFVFSFSLLLLWDAWHKDQRAQSTPVAAGQPDMAAGGSGVPSPSAPARAIPAPSATPKAAQALPAEQTAPGKHERLQVTTDALRAEIDTLGGDITYVELLKHPDTELPQKNFILLGPQHHYAAQSGLTGEGMPNHKTVFVAAAKQYGLQPGQDKLQVRLEAAGTNGASGVKVAKIITFHRDSYLIDITHELTNSGAAPLAAHAYAQLTRDGKAPDGDTVMMNTYYGPAAYTDADKFRKLPFDDIGGKPLSKTADNGWVAILQHYFVAALVLQEKLSREFYTRKLSDDLYAVGAIFPLPEAAPGATVSANVALYAGPQEQDNLKAIAPGLELVVDYGWLTVIAAPLFWVLKFFHGWLGNWGLAIILLTVCIKLIFYPLSAASYRSMAKMKLITPRMTRIREQYADDRMKQNQAMMELYKQEKINPLGGCLPIVVQIPVFISLYWVLLASVELRQAPFYAWIADLSAADPYYILPALMMVSMVVQTRMSPTPPDPIQAKVMQIMPLVFGLWFFVFPAGLVLYWLVNNVLSILQQWHITRGLEAPKQAGRTSR